MQKLVTWRRVIAALSFLGLVVIALNIERVAEVTGLDRLLVSALRAAPDWLSNVLKVLTSQTAFIIAVIVVAYAGGLLTEGLLRSLRFRLNKPLDKDALANECEGMARLLRTAESFGHSRNTVMGVCLDLIRIQHVFRKKLGVALDLEPTTEEDALRAADLLERLAMPVRKGDIDKIKQIAANPSPQPAQRRAPRGKRAKKQP